MVHGLVLSYNQESDLHQARFISQARRLMSRQSCTLMVPISHHHVRPSSPGG